MCVTSNYTTEKTEHAPCVSLIMPPWIVTQKSKFFFFSFSPNAETLLLYLAHSRKWEIGMLRLRCASSMIATRTANVSVETAASHDKVPTQSRQSRAIKIVILLHSDICVLLSVSFQISCRIASALGFCFRTTSRFFFIHLLFTKIRICFVYEYWIRRRREKSGEKSQQIARNSKWHHFAKIDPLACYFPTTSSTSCVNPLRCRCRQSCENHIYSVFLLLLRPV